MACGRPVIRAAVGGIQYTVQDGVTGYLVPPRDPEVLAACLERLLGQPALCARLGAAARARVEREFTWPVTAERTAAVYEELRAARARQLATAAPRLRSGVVTADPSVAASDERADSTTVQPGPEAALVRSGR
jgi:hypothetical protein